MKHNKVCLKGTQVVSGTMQNGGEKRQRWERNRASLCCHLLSHLAQGVHHTVIFSNNAGFL